MIRGVSLNVAIIPDADLLEESVRLSGKISRTLGSVITLAKNTPTPHINLYQACYPSKNVKKVKKEIEKIIRDTPSFSLALNDFSVALDTYVFWNCLRNKDLQKLHNQIVQKLNPLREGLILPHLARVTGMKKEDVEDVQKYGALYIGKRYQPHITLSRLSQKQNPKRVFDLIGKMKDADFRVENLVLAKVGEGGTLTKVIKKFSFKK